MSFEVKQIITQIVAFLIMLWILKKYAWKPLLALMHERTRKIQAAFDEIENKNRLVDWRMAEYEEKMDHIKAEGQVIIQNAVKKGQKAAHDLQVESQKKANEIIKKAQEEIERERAKAQAKLKQEVVNLALQAFEKLARLKLTKEERDQFGLQLVDEV